MNGDVDLGKAITLATPFILELVDWIRKRQRTHSSIPTDAEVLTRVKDKIAAAEKEANEFEAEGESE